MDTLFRQYEAEYCAKSTSASKKLPSIEGLAGDARRRRVQEVEAELKSADDVLKRMDMEARSLPAEHSRPLLQQVKEYRADLAALKEQAKQASRSTVLGDAARAELGLGGDFYSTSAGQREKMLTSTQRLEKSSEHLHHGREQLVQTEELGASILRDLAGQRETIMHSKATLQSTDDNITKARKVLTTMGRRMMQNKIIMAGIILFLVLGIIMVLYSKLR